MSLHLIIAFDEQRNCYNGMARIGAEPDEKWECRSVNHATARDCAAGLLTFVEMRAAEKSGVYGNTGVP